MGGVIQNIAALESQVGTRPAAVNLKVIDHLDAQALKWVAVSPLAFAGFSDAERIDITIAGGDRGFATASSANQLRLPRALLDDPGHARAGCGVGLLFLIPGLGETLRVNGRVEAATDEDMLVTVHECYAHCAKALLRSQFWQAADTPSPGDAQEFLAAARYMALATADTALNTDVSPKGDPAGMLVRPCGGGIRYADRPGNRRTDSFRNILARPSAAAVLVVPGCTRVAVLQGGVQIDADPALRQSFAVQDKAPKLVSTFMAPSLVLRESAALARARPWEAVSPPSDIDPAEIFAAHVKLNKARGLGAMIAKGMVSVPGLMRKGLEQDYKRNLY
ncbi:pyridoxamine 5'-phosphate oxidase family protein [Bordetella petrii]|uniref:pyridoxamine 5'-phosphate oxidase family protein n=1 Tax=Bordetella petrii TaxID=94624 RepID=UPI001E566479|nr:pyridoxamine 5'-phosphate oxidase family protein [Bordetella petrii]MCD0502202.1 pyridoxamine 5'-phosphate oxidase family protein [Bordetella petrii]